MKRRELLPYEYKAFTGVVLTDLHVDAYNRTQERINSFIDAGMPVSENLLNEAHKAFSLFSGCYT